MFYMAVTSDKFELPLCVTENVEELAAWAGISVIAIKSAIRRGSNGKARGYKLVKIAAEDEYVPGAKYDLNSTKTCPHCNRKLLLGDFPIYKGTIYSYCRSCKRETQREYVKKYKEKKEKKNGIS